LSELAVNATCPWITTRGVAKQSVDPAGSVEVARGVAIERLDSVGSVFAACAVAKQSIDSDGGVELARSVVLKRACPQTGVGLGCSNPRQRERENERSNKNGENGFERQHINPLLVFKLFGQQSGHNIVTLKKSSLLCSPGFLSYFSPAVAKV
jgi:hypothetical protein